MSKNLFYSTNELELRVQKWLELIRRQKPGSYACNIPVTLVSCDGEHRELIFRVETGREMENPWGVVHGGMLALALDWVMGISARTVLDQCDAPTVSMNVNYLRPVPLESTLRIHVSVIHAGNSLATLSARAFVEGDDRACVSAEGVYFMRNKPLVLEEP